MKTKCKMMKMIPKGRQVNTTLEAVPVDGHGLLKPDILT